MEFEALCLVFGLSQPSPSGFMVCAPDEKSEEQTLWITPGSEVLLALSHLSLRRVPGVPLHLANLGVIFSRRFSGQLTPLTVIIRSRFPNSAIHGPLRASERMDESPPYLCFFLGKLDRGV